MSSSSSYQPNNWMMYPPVRSSPSPYEILIRQSRKLGQTATQALAITKSLVPGKLAPLIGLAPLTEQQFFERNPDRIHVIAKHSHEVLLQARTVPFLPHNLFPDTIIIDRMKIKVIVWRSFFLKETLMMPFGDIKHISLSSGVLFSSVTITHQDGDLVIEGLRNRDASRICCIIRGYRIAMREGVNVDELSTDRLLRKLSELGGGEAA